MARDFRRSLIGYKVAGTERFLSFLEQEIAARREAREAQIAALHQEQAAFQGDVRTIEEAISRHEQAQSALRSTLTLLSEQGVRKVQDAQERMAQDDAQRMAVLARRESMLSQTGRLLEEFRSGVLALIEKTLAALATNQQFPEALSDPASSDGTAPIVVQPGSAGAASAGK